ncbi:MAG: tetratricopeptide repeat protein, partial [Cyanobacteria bacterium J06650_10]
IASLNLDSLTSNEASFYRHRAAVMTRARRFEEAIADYTTALELSPTAHAFYQRGKLYCQNSEFEKALTDFDASIELSPEYGMVYCDRAQLRFKAHDLTGALSDSQKTTDLLSNPPKETYITRCLIHFSLGNKQQALQDFEQLIQQIKSSFQSSSQTSNDSTSMGSVGG